MKKFLFILLAISVILIVTGCFPANPAETDRQGTEQPENTAAPADEAENQPSDTFSTESGTEESANPSFPYTLKITRPDLLIHTGPGYDYTDIGIVVDIGTYTITEEFVDDEGFKWGKLKSGIGWIDLDKANAEAPHIPITLERTSAASVSRMDCHKYVVDEAEYTQWLYLQAYEPLSDIRFTFMDFTEDGFEPGKELYSLEKMTADKPLVIGVVFYGDFTTFGLTFTDAAGAEHQYRIYESGRNGSVVMQEYTS